MDRCPLFVELCAGTVAVSLRLQGGNRCRPVVSRMGAKTGYANVILACFGLTPGGKAGAYLWCEPDPGARLLLQALPQPEVLREAASVIRGWASEDPRNLWEALRKEGPPKGVDGREVARWLQILGCTVDGLGGGRFVGWTCPQNAAAIAHNGPKYSASLEARFGRDARNRILSPASAHPDVQTARLDRVPRFTAVSIFDDARSFALPKIPEGTVCYIDGPYEKTAGYGADLPRSEQVELARRWSDAGAFVGISEQEPIPELIADGWHAVEITHGRKGAVRSFSRQQSEFLTLNRPPVNPPLLGEQVRLWA